MIVDDLNIERAPLFPAEADPPSFVDTDAVPTLPVSFQGFEVVAGWRRQVPQNPGPMKVQQFPARRPLERFESCHRKVVKEAPGILVSEGPDHSNSLLLIE
jgi:hypothetical protein